MNNHYDGSLEWQTRVGVAGGLELDGPTDYDHSTQYKMAWSEVINNPTPPPDPLPVQIEASITENTMFKIINHSSRSSDLSPSSFTLFVKRVFMTRDTREWADSGSNSTNKWYKGTHTKAQLQIYISLVLGDRKSNDAPFLKMYLMFPIGNLNHSRSC